MLAPIPVDAHDPAKQEADLDQEQVPQEAHLRPHEGDRAAVSAGERFWTRVALDDIPIDFNQFLGEVTEQAVAYAVCYVESDADRSFLVVKVGNDDSAKVYLNGRQVYRDAFGGPFAPDRHEVSGIELKAGLNTVVFKV
jgi:hypothetical protein